MAEAPYDGAVGWEDWAQLGIPGAGVSLPGLQRGLRKEGHWRRCFAGALGLWVLGERVEA